MKALEYGWGGLACYLATGAIFAVVFLLRGVARLDPQARSGTWGFKIMIFPGCVLLWPLLMSRWIAGHAAPPEEWTAHRRACRISTLPSPAELPTGNQKS